MKPQGAEAIFLAWRVVGKLHVIYFSCKKVWRGLAVPTPGPRLCSSPGTLSEKRQEKTWLNKCSFPSQKGHPAASLQELLSSHLVPS